MSDDQIHLFLERIADFEMLLVDRALIKKLGQLTDRELDRARSECQLTVAQTASKNIKTVEHNFTELVVFTEAWVQGELQVHVKSAYGQLASSSDLVDHMKGSGLDTSPTTFH